MEAAAGIAISLLFWYVLFRFGVGRERLVRFIEMLRRRGA